jgi:hypothetical protein
MLRRPTSDSFAQSVMSCLQRSPGHRAVSYDWLYISETAGCTLRSSRSQSSVCSGTCKAAHEYAELRCTHALSAITKVGFVRLETCDLASVAKGTSRPSDTLSSSCGKCPLHERVMPATSKLSSNSKIMRCRAGWESFQVHGSLTSETECLLSSRSPW